MRILSWNINGIRTIPQYHPWNKLKSCEAILEYLQADIICFQEMKTSRSALDRDTAIPGPYNSFFSFPVNKGGYSGVAIYADSRTAVPIKAEEGLSGKLQPKPALSPEERISTSYPQAHEMDLMADEEGNTPSDLIALDTEGRALILDFGLFVLINLYCPNETSDARLPFKMNYHFMLQERVRKLREEGREVIVLGDINICATPIDHCDGHLSSIANSFFDHPARGWFRRWLDPDSAGHMIDVLRRFWPDRTGMYTCWNTKISARETNYGTRIDYILVTPGLLPWIKHGDIQPSLKGSDHCPVYIDLHDEITLELTGEKITLRDVMRMNGDVREPPRLAAKFWEEHAGKQTLLSNFFGKRQHASPGGAESSVSTDETSSIPSTPVRPASPLKSRPMVSQTNKTAKRKFSADIAPSSSSSSSTSKTKKPKVGQTKLSTFFVKPSPVTKTQPDVDTGVPPSMDEDPLESDHLFALQLSNSQESTAPPPSSSNSSATQSKASWSQLLAPIKPPCCPVHNEPGKEFTVNKPGPNKGKKFFVCSRPVGPGYDKGKAERLRAEVDPQYRCNFFKWSSDVKRESLKR